MPDETFGERLKRFLAEKGLTYAQATLKTKGRIKRTYWSPLTDNSQPPTERILRILAETFPNEPAIREMWRLAGRILPPEYRPPAARGDEPPHAIPGAVAVVSSDVRLPLGPPVSAMRGHDLGDVETHDEVGVSREWVEKGATIAVTVEGECLAPDLLPGDYAALCPQDHATHRQIVLVRLEDGTFTLKRFVENGVPRLTTNDPRRFPPPVGPFQIVAVVVGSWRNHR